jgi:hypothetical protein
MINTSLVKEDLIDTLALVDGGTAKCHCIQTSS